MGGREGGSMEGGEAGKEEECTNQTSPYHLHSN